MFLRSVNAVRVFPVVFVLDALVAVAYSGMVVQAAIVVCRVNFICVTAPGAGAILLGLQVSQDGLGGHRLSVNPPTAIVGDVGQLTLVGLFDLEPGDVIEVVGNQSLANRWAIDVDGMSVMIR